MALQHRISDALKMWADHDTQGMPVVDMEFKFIRYRLVVDDINNARRLVGLLNEIIDADIKKDAVEVLKPKFYKSGGV